MNRDDVTKSNVRSLLRCFRPEQFARIALSLSYGSVATNKLTGESSVEFKLSSSGDVRVFTFYAVGGDPKQGRSFVYKVDGDDFYDIPGLLQGNNYRNYQASPTIWHWKRVKEEPKDAPPP